VALSLVRIYDGSNPPVEIGIRINGVGKDGFIQVLYSEIPGNSWNQQRLNRFRDQGQLLIDERTLRTDLDPDDPARLADPALPNWFWDGTDIVARPYLLGTVTFTDKLNVEIIRTH